MERILIADGLGVPRDAPATLLVGRHPVVGWMPHPPQWARDLTSGTALMGSPALRSAVAGSCLGYVPVRYASIPRLVAGRLRPDIVVLSARPSGSGFQFGLEVGYGRIAAELAPRVVIEVDESLPQVDGPEIPKVSEVVEAASPAPEAPASQPPDEVDRRIGAAIASLVPRGATVQYGPGSVGEAALRALDVRVRVASGLVTDAVAGLADRGLLVGQVSTAYLYGGAALRDLAAAGMVRLDGIELTHAPARLAALENLVSINAAITVGLDGSVNVERADAQLLSGVGGHPDFCRAASSSESGLSVIGLRSVHAGRSAIVPVAQPVSTPRTDVDVVVTEHGVADLRGLDEHARACALLALSDPACRDELERSLAV